MSPNQIIALIIRLFSIFIVLTALRYLMVYFNSYGSEERIFLFGYIIFTLIVAVVLWKFPFTVSKFIYSPENELKPETWTKDETYIAGFVIVGVYYLYYSFLDLVHWALYLITINRMDKNFDVIGAYEISSIITTVLELVLALALILGASGLKNILFKIRYAGLSK